MIVTSIVNIRFTRPLHFSILHAQCRRDGGLRSSIPLYERKKMERFSKTTLTTLTTTINRKVFELASPPFSPLQFVHLYGFAFLICDFSRIPFDFLIAFEIGQCWTGPPNWGNNSALSSNNGQMSVQGGLFKTSA